jgi:hypothetical protein
VQPAARPAVVLDVALDPAASRVSGHLQLRLTNTSGAALTEVPLWLYPNHLATPPAGLTDVNFHWLYPGTFSPADMQVRGARVDGATARLAVADTAAGTRTLARVALPAPVAPGGPVTVDVDFETRLPRRFGAFGCDGARCRLMGGFYPMMARLGPRGFETDAPPDPVDARVTVRAPPGLALVVDGQPIVRAAGAPVDAPVTVDSRDVPYATIVTDRVLRVATAAAGGREARLLHRRPRPPDSEDQPLPYVREDVPGLILGAARAALAFLADQGLAAGTARPITLVEAPLRHELVQVHGDVVLVSDQIFGIFPAARLRKYHRFEIARAVLTAAVGDALAATERGPDRDLAAGVLAAYLTDLFALREEGQLEHARDLLRPFDFIPAVDQLMYAPLVAASQTYFGDVDDDDHLRDDVRRFATDDPDPHLVYSKLLDLLGPAGMASLGREVLGRGVPLRAAAAGVFGGDLGWFWRQWLGPRPRVNYRLAAVRVQGAAPAVHVTVDVTREGDDVREPVEVRIEDRAGNVHNLTWSERGPAHRFEIDLPAPLASVEVDPRERLVETALGSLDAADDPRADNRRPARWRLLYEGFGGLLNISELTANFAAIFLLKPQHDLRNEIELQAFHTEALAFGAAATYERGFGAQVNRNELAGTAWAGATVARLNPSFGLPAGAAPQPGSRFEAHLGIGHDTRDYLIDPWRGVGVDVEAVATLTALDSGQHLAQVTGSAEALRLIPLLPGHVLAVDGSAAATAGDVRLPSQLVAAGGLGGLRGYLASDLLSRAQAIGRVELRDDYVTELGWNLLHLSTVRALAGTLFADAAAITSCDGYTFSRRNVFTDVGYSFRVLYDGFGVYQQLFSIDVAVPLNRRADPSSCLGMPAATPTRPPFVVMLSFLPSF